MTKIPSYHGTVAIAEMGGDFQCIVCEEEHRSISELDDPIEYVDCFNFMLDYLSALVKEDNENNKVAVPNPWTMDFPKFRLRYLAQPVEVTMEEYYEWLDELRKRVMKFIEEMGYS